MCNIAFAQSIHGKRSWRNIFQYFGQFSSFSRRLKINVLTSNKHSYSIKKGYVEGPLELYCKGSYYKSMIILLMDESIDRQVNAEDGVRWRF